MSVQYSKQRTILFYGRTGSGKGTQSELLKKHLEKSDPEHKVLYVATGARFRELMARDNHTARMIRQVLDHGKLMPEFLPIWIWTSELMERFTGKEHLILDGPARRSAESPILHSTFAFYNRLPADVIMLECSAVSSRVRLSDRGRHDDQEIIIAKRLAEYEEHIVLAIEFFRKNADYNFHTISGEGTIEEVHKDILKALDL
jgi:adenylate kinase family enzyme